MYLFLQIFVLIVTAQDADIDIRSDDSTQNKKEVFLTVKFFTIFLVVWEYEFLLLFFIDWNCACFKYLTKQQIQSKRDGARKMSIDRQYHSQAINGYSS